MNTTTTTTSIELAKAKNPVTPAITREAHALRKQLAEDYNVPTKFVRFKDCLAVALGRKKIDNVRNCFGYKLNSRASRIHRTLLCDPDTPTFMFAQNIADMTGEPLKFVRRQFFLLQRDGVMVNDGSLWRIEGEQRPFPQPLALG